MIASQSSNKIYGYWLMQRLIVYLLVLRYIQSLQKNQANGNLTRKTELDDDGKTKTTAYSYDFENRLIKVEIKDEEKTKIVSFAYDPFGRRISKSVQYLSLRGEAEAISDDDEEKDDHDYENPKTTYYVYDNEDIIAEYNSKGKITARYTHGLGIDEPLSVKKKDNTYYYHADGLGSITALTDEKGKTVQTYEYDSFGNLKNHEQKIKQPYAYTAREYDPETKLYYYRARYYDAKIGRFISFDPILHPSSVPQKCGQSKNTQPSFESLLDNSQNLNPFVYVGNNAVNWADPLGLSEKCVWAGFSGVIAIGVGVQVVKESGRCVDDCGKVTYKNRTCVCSCVGIGVSGSGQVSSGDSSTTQSGWNVSTPYGSVSGSGSTLTGAGYGPGAGLFYCWCHCQNN